MCVRIYLMSEFTRLLVLLFDVADYCWTNTRASLRDWYRDYWGIVWNPRPQFTVCFLKIIRFAESSHAGFDNWHVKISISIKWSKWTMLAANDLAWARVGREFFLRSMTLTLCQLVLSADNICKQLCPRPGPIWIWTVWWYFWKVSY